MTKLESLKVLKAGFPFAVKMTDYLKQEYDGLYDENIEKDYLHEMINEVLKDNLVVTFDFYNNQLSDIQELSEVYGDDKIQLEGRIITGGYRTFLLADTFVITDKKAYSEYLISIENESVQKRIEELNKTIEDLKKDHADMLRLGLKLYKNRQLDRIRKIELIRGTEVKPEEVETLLASSIC